MWWLLVACAASAYVSWIAEQRARERFARKLGAAGKPHLRRLLLRHPLYSHHRPVSAGSAGKQNGLAGLYRAPRQTSEGEHNCPAPLPKLQALLAAIELYAMAAILWEALATLLPPLFNGSGGLGHALAGRLWLVGGGSGESAGGPLAASAAASGAAAQLEL